MKKSPYVGVLVAVLRRKKQIKRCLKCVIPEADRDEVCRIINEYNSNVLKCYEVRVH